MKLLIDTQLLIWMGRYPEKLSRKAGQALGDEANQLLFSSLVVAEVAIKRAKGGPDFPEVASMFRARLLANAFEELPLTGAHAARLADLPPIHKDPFDRLMIAQALAEGMPFVTADSVLGGYPGRVMVV